ncbi:MAG: LptF/LptG family permease [Kiritimatiellia bacterium]
MKILSRYVLREFLVPLTYCLLGFLSIYVLFELFGSFSRIAEARLPFLTIVRYFAAFLAPYFMWLAPAALMLATLYTMWNFCRHTEITAMRASGVSFMAIVKPLLFVALLMSGFVAWVNESYVPRMAQWAKQLKTDRFDAKKLAKADGLVYCDANARRMWTIERMADDDAECLEGVTITIDRADGGRLKTITADRADYLEGEWWLSGAVVRHFDASGDECPSPEPELDAMKFRLFPELRERPGDILQQNRDWQFNSTRSKFRFIRRHADLTAAQRVEYTYDAWAQAVAPFACLVITLFAIPAGISSGRQSVFKGVLGALAMFFTFYGVTIGCMVAAHKECLPPILAAFLPDVLFLILGIRAFMRQR